MFALLCPSKKTQIRRDVQILLTFAEQTNIFKIHPLEKRQFSANLIHDKIELWGAFCCCWKSTIRSLKSNKR